MGNNNINKTNDILIKVDQNNLIYIDPNSEINSDGHVQPRSVEPENLVMYVNLEADLIPRTTLIGEGSQNVLTSIAGGTLNFLRNDKGRDYDTKWTEAYSDIQGSAFNFESTGTFATLPAGSTPRGGSSDGTGQSFGITNISIDVAGANFIPKVVINFVDVRGKTLFESPENSPYAAFFHLPWPIFYLTIKGFYGKAIKYRLHLVKFNTRFNSQNGNMEVETQFVGSTYAYLADISLEAILNAPYFYISENSENSTTNEGKGTTQISVSKSTKGYRILKSVYQEYISKGLLPSGFPVRTLRELIIIAGKLNQTLEKEIFESVVDPKILAGVKEYEDLMNNLEGGILAWKTKYVSPDYFLQDTRVRENGEKIRWFKMTGDKKNTLDNVTNPRNEGTLERILNIHITKLEENSTFGNKRDKKLIKADDLTITPVSLTPLKDIKEFYNDSATTIGIDMDGLQDALYTVYRNFIEQRNKLESDIEKRMNEIVKDKTKGIGFEPTIRNLIGVVLANADTYIRLMKDVHVKAFENANVRKKILSGIETDSDKASECIYPWPEIITQGAGGKQRTLMYPGSRELLGKLQSNNKDLWPEVEFVENFYNIATKKLDPLSLVGDNAVEFVFSTQGSTEKIDLSVLTNVIGVIPYADKSFPSVLYEMYERAKYATSLNPFDEKSIRELAEVEFENMKMQLAEDVDLIDLLQQNIKTPNDLLSYMQALSTFDRFPYYEDQLPTTWYLKEGISQDYTIRKYVKTEKTNSYDSSYENLSNFLLNYQPEEYRTKIYPFNSLTYEGYLGEDFSPKLLNLNGLLKIDTPNDFIVSPVDGTMWVKDGYSDNMFSYTVDFNGTPKHILNTPYFHKQLYSEWDTPKTRQKYVGSAYLLLNSLPFKDLDDTIYYTSKTSNGQTTSEPTLMSTLFREIGAAHTIPYHMMLKWGSIYHRYKRWVSDVDNPYDIISGATDVINDDLFYSGATYTGTSYNDIPQSDSIGFHPYYETIFSQITNGYLFFNPSEDGKYEESIINKNLYLYQGITTGANVYSSFVDNTKFGYSGYTLLPTNGGNVTYGTDINGIDINKSKQENFRILWSIGVNDTEEINYPSFPTFPTDYFYKDKTSGNFSISENYRKVVDLIATFKPEILESFEQAFLDFTNEKVKEEITYIPYNVPYPKFQDLLKDIVSVTKSTSDSTFDSFKLMKEVKSRQTNNLVTITNTLLSVNNLVKIIISNPREIDNYVLGGFTGINVAHFSTDTFSSSNASGYRLYLGDNLDGNTYYDDFFQMMDIQPTEENIKQFRQIIYIYAGLRAENISFNKPDFVKYLIDNLIDPTYIDRDGNTTNKNVITGVAGQDKRLFTYLEHLIVQKIPKLEVPTTANTATSQRGYNDDPIKLELYNYFKSFNDKWTAGNSIGQRTLLEEFLFLDKANRDIGNDLFLDMQKIVRLGEDGNKKINLFSVLGLLVHDSGIDIRALPAYVNFYGSDFTKTSKTMPSKSVAQTMFGAFLEVDHQDSGPKIILQYTGPTSKHLELSDIDKKQKFKNDGFDISDVNNNPIIVGPDVFYKTDFTKENKVVAFEVSFGDQNQSIFKGVELDQATLRNTSESFEVLERLGRNETGSSTSQIDIGLFNIYRQSSYQCKVTCMGNMMIQPTMYFYVKNIPLFRGSYLITEVKHSITTNGIETSFKGTRIPKESLPNPTDSFLASYRPLFDRIIAQARTKIANETKQLSGNTGTATTLIDGRGNAYTTDPGNTIIKGETIQKKAGYTEYGIPYNGITEDKTIQLVTYEHSPKSPYGGNEWLRAKAVLMGGPNYKVDQNTVMNIVSSLTYGHNFSSPFLKTYWSDLEKLSVTQPFYSCKFVFGSPPLMSIATPDQIVHTYKRTEFINPLLYNTKYENDIVTIENRIYFDTKIYEGPVNVGPSKSEYGVGLSADLMKRLNLKDGDVVYFRMTK